MRTLAALLLLVVILAFASGCAVGPNYKRPAVNVPPFYRGLAPEEAAKSDARSLADEKWWEVFQDEQLRELIKTALQQNYDVRIVRMTFTSVSDYLPVPFGSQGPASPDSAPLYLLDASVYETIWMQKGHTETHPKSSGDAKF